MKEFYEINVSPYATNVLDLVHKDDLCIPNGDPVYITRDGIGCFVIFVSGSEKCRTSDNVAASYYLNSIQVGRMG